MFLPAQSINQGNSNAAEGRKKIGTKPELYCGVLDRFNVGYISVSHPVTDIQTAS